ncbi:MAG TPA: serpin family protein [Longimicrobiaceae bacterium]|nr:serpin family protein [Longimicrobiaceae bacterium]
MNRHSASGLALLLAATLGFASKPAACQRPDTTQAPAQEVPGQLAFGLRLFQEVARSKADSNAVISPSSAGVALMLAYNGAEGATRTAMGTTLGVGGHSIAEMNAAFSVWMRDVSRPGAAQLTVANSLWVRDGVPFRSDFLERTRTGFGAEVTALDFGSASAPSTINAWVSRATHGRIDRIVGEPLDPTSVLVLVNAVYFKGLWQTPFDRSATRPRAFTAPHGEHLMLPTMERYTSLDYVADSAFHVVRMPYEGGRLSMYVFLPRGATGLDELRARLSEQSWRGWLASMSPRDVHVVLPKFRLEGSTSLVPPLRRMGMGVAFDSARADFSGMIPREWLTRHEYQARISGVTQKTFVEVDEKGTEAAAVTAIVMVTIATGSEVRRPPTEFIVDRPFVFVIRDDRTGALLFIGQVTDPRG